MGGHESQALDIPVMWENIIALYTKHKFNNVENKLQRQNFEMCPSRWQVKGGKLSGDREHQEHWYEEYCMHKTQFSLKVSQYSCN